MTRLNTERLTLRPLELTDAARFSRLSSDPGVARLTAHLPCPNPLIAAEGYILLKQARAGLRDEETFALDLAGEGLIGVFGVRAAGASGNSRSLGFWIGRPFWGRGYATEAGQVMLAHLHAQSASPIQACHFADNPAGGRVLEKLGFTPVGEISQGFSLARGALAPIRSVALAAPRRAAA
jgi:RimJ/RimL family protein N-acetyltransferase